MSMSCKESQRWISMKVDGERIPFSVAGHFDEHLRACGPCRELLSIESRRVVILENVLHQADAAGLKASILMGLEEEPGAGRSIVPPFFISRSVLRAAAVLLVAVGGWLSLRFFASEGHAPGISRIILEQDQLKGDVFSESDGSPMRRETHQLHRLIFEPSQGGKKGSGDGDGDGGGSGAREPVRLHKAKTKYIRLVDFPYW